MNTQILVVQLFVTAGTWRLPMARVLVVPAHRLVLRDKGLFGLGSGSDLGLVSRFDLSLEGLQLPQKPRIRIDLHKTI